MTATDDASSALDVLDVLDVLIVGAGFSGLYLLDRCDTRSAGAMG